MTAPPDKLLRRKAVLRVGAASWCFGSAFLRSRFAQSWPLKRDGQPHRTRRIRAGAAGVILDCACAPIHEPLKRADAHGVSDLSPPTVIPCALRRRLETNLVAQAQSRHPPHAATRLFRSRTFHQPLALRGGPSCEEAQPARPGSFRLAWRPR